MNPCMNYNVRQLIHTVYLTSPANFSFIRLNDLHIVFQNSISRCSRSFKGVPAVLLKLHCFATLTCCPLSESIIVFNTDHK